MQGDFPLKQVDTNLKNRRPLAACDVFGWALLDAALVAKQPVGIWKFRPLRTAKSSPNRAQIWRGKSQVGGLTINAATQAVKNQKEKPFQIMANIVK
jgi:hypothetical protein